MEEQLFRSVEGQAASDEEEDKWTGDQQRQVDEVKRILTRLSCCGERYCTSIHHHFMLKHRGTTLQQASNILNIIWWIDSIMKFSVTKIRVRD